MALTPNQYKDENYFFTLSYPIRVSQMVSAPSEENSDLWIWVIFCAPQRRGITWLMLEIQAVLYNRHFSLRGTVLLKILGVILF
jgi:hypothetical protein